MPAKRMLLVCALGGLFLPLFGCQRIPYGKFVGDYVDVEIRDASYELARSGCLTEVSSQALTLEYEGRMVVIALPDVIAVSSRGPCADVLAELKEAEERWERERAAAEQAWRAQQAARETQKKEAESRQQKSIEDWLASGKKRDDQKAEKVNPVTLGETVKAQLIFADRSVDLPPNHESELAEIVGFLRRYPKSRAYQEVDAGYLYSVAERDRFRARTRRIADYLESSGIAAGRIDIEDPPSRIGPEDTSDDCRSISVRIIWGF